MPAVLSFIVGEWRRAKQPTASARKSLRTPWADRDNWRRLLDHGEDVVLGHDEQFFAVDGYFVAGVGGE